MPTHRNVPLPDEIIKEILAPGLEVPMERFMGWKYYHPSPFTTPDHHTTSTVLTVCKQWFRVATPLLYRTVILRSTEQAAVLYRALTEHPSLGAFIKQLCLEGPYGELLHKIVHIANIEDVCFCFLVRSADEAAQLWDMAPALYDLNPRTAMVYISLAREDYFLPPLLLNDFDRIQGFCATICTCFREVWSDLRHVYLPIVFHAERRGEWNPMDLYREFDDTGLEHDCFSLSLSQSPNLQAVDIMLHDDSETPPDLQTLFWKLSTNPSLRVINYPASGTVYLSQEIIIKLGSILHSGGRSWEQILEDAHERSTHTPLASSLPSRFDDAILTRIFDLHFEGDVREQGSWFTPMKKVNHQLVLVCRKFHRLATPLLYRRPILHGDSNALRFANRILDDPSIHQHIEAIFKTGPDYDENRDVIQTALEIIFTSCPNIKVVDDSPTPGIWENRSYLVNLSPKVFRAVCATSAQNIAVFRPTSICPPVEGAHALLFGSFRKLVSLRWNESWANLDVSISKHLVSPDMFSHLVSLEYTHYREGGASPVPHLLEALCQTDLPSLQTLALEGNCPGAVEFAKRHAGKIVNLTLKMQDGQFPGSLLQYCTAVTILKFKGTVLKCSAEYRSVLLDCTSKKHPLTKIIISPNAPMISSSYPQGEKELQPWKPLLDSALYSGFPALSEIEVIRCGWPQDEYSLRHNYWPKFSADLAAINVKLLSSHGKPWTPRMGDTGCTKNVNPVIA